MDHSLLHTVECRRPRLLGLFLWLSSQLGGHLCRALRTLREFQFPPTWHPLALHGIAPFPEPLDGSVDLSETSLTGLLLWIRDCPLNCLVGCQSRDGLMALVDGWASQGGCDRRELCCVYTLFSHRPERPRHRYRSLGSLHDRLLYGAAEPHQPIPDRRADGNLHSLWYGHLSVFYLHPYSCLPGRHRVGLDAFHCCCRGPMKPPSYPL